MPEPAIRCKSLTKRYPTGTLAVAGIDLEISRGECFGLLGPNGAGKTTTIEILEGLLEPTSGEVEVLGLTWAGGERELRRRIGISLQETRLSEKLSAAETIRLFRSFYERGLEPFEALELVGLSGKSRTWVGKLSGGERQRLAVACALVGDPELLFLDEPTTGLDPASRRGLWDILRSLRRRGRTILLTTHYMDEAEKLCDRVAIIDRGRVIALGSPADLIASLGGEHVIEFRDVPVNGAGPAPLELESLPGVRSVRTNGAETALTVAEPHVTLPALLRHLEDRGRHLRRLITRHASLEDVFVRLTGRHLDEGADEGREASE